MIEAVPVRLRSLIWEARRQLATNDLENDYYPTRQDPNQELTILAAVLHMYIYTFS